MSATALSSDAAMAVLAEETVDHPRFCDVPAAIRDRAKRLLVLRRNDLIDAVADELSTLHDALVLERRARRNIVMAVLVVSIAFTATSAIAFVALILHPTAHASALPIGLAIAYVVILIGALFGVRHSYRSTVRPAVDRTCVHRRAVDEEIVQQATLLARAIMDTLLAEESIGSEVFDRKVAPTVIELDSIATIAAASHCQVIHLIKEHRSSVVGLAGPRGSGKTTIMERLALGTDINCFGLRVPVTVDYEPIDLVRLLHNRLSRELIKRRGSGGAISAHAASTATSIRLILQHVLRFFPMALGLVLIALELRPAHASSPPALSWFAGIGLLLVGLSIGTVVAASLIRRNENRRRGLAQPSSLEHLAREQLRMLEWSAAVQQKAKADIKIAQILTLAGEDQVSMSQRERTYADSVETLRSFLERVHQQLAQPVVICIDDLDKSADVDKSAQVINSLNGLFRVAGVHFVISIPPIANFWRLEDAVERAIGALGVFDTVVEVEKLTARESISLLDIRLGEFGPGAKLFCHAWSGGNARELIRTARLCVDYRRARGTPILLETLVPGVIRRDIRDLVRHLADRYMKTCDVSTLIDLHAHLDGKAPLGEVLTGAVNRVRTVGANRVRPPCQEVAKSEDGSETICRGVGAAVTAHLRIAIVLNEFFSAPRNAAFWRDGRTISVVDLLAAARAAVVSNIKEAEHLTKAAQAAINAFN